MPYKVISPRCCRESAEVLQEFLNVRYPLPSDTNDVLINWGNSNIERYPHVSVFGNKLEAVSRSSNKDTFFSLCKDLSTVPVVYGYEEPGVFQHMEYLSDGRGVAWVDNQLNFTRGYLSTKKIVGTEYRVYFCYDMLMSIFRKVKMDDDAADSSIQCSTNGYGYTKTLQKIPSLKTTLREMTTQVANRLELSMGAVDFIVEKDTNLVYVLETNSAPTLFLDEIVDSFAEAISRRFGYV